MNTYHRHRGFGIAATIGISALVSLIVLVLASVFVYENRARIFDQFASEYVAEVAQRAAEPAAEDGEREPVRNILTQDASVVDIVAEANPAVVSIVVTKDVPIVERYYEEVNPFGDFFGFNFQVPQLRERGTERREVGGGSGFFVSSDGLVVTNRHVVEDDEASYTVFTNTGEQYDAEVVARDPFFDIAVLSVDGEGFSALSFGDSDSLRLGQTVIAIGNALAEFRNSVSVGVVSGLSRSIVAGTGGGATELLEEVIQTDAAINPGNSGGPLLDLHGRVIGVNVAVALSSENIGFALPANVVKGVVESVREFGEIVRPYLGVRYVQIDERVAERDALPVDYGALIVAGEGGVSGIVPDSPAARAGLQEGDIILSLGGRELSGNRTLAAAIRAHSVGEEVAIVVLRDGQERTLTATLARAPERL